MKSNVFIIALLAAYLVGAASDYVIGSYLQFGVGTKITSMTDGKFTITNAAGSAGSTISVAGGNGHFEIQSIDGLVSYGRPEIRLVARVPDISLNTTDAQNLYTTPAGKSFIFTHVVGRDLSGTAVDANGTFGSTTSSCEDLTDTIEWVGAGTALFVVGVPKTPAAKLSGGTAICYKGDTLDNLTVVFDLYGYFL